MKKFSKILAVTLLLTFSMCMTAFAGAWQWLDGNGDGIAESYYFDENGNLLTGTTTPDGYTVDANGAWTVDGVIQQKNTDAAQPVAGEAGDAAAREMYLYAVMKNSQLSNMDVNIKVDLLTHDSGEKYRPDHANKYITTNIKVKNLGSADMKYIAVLEEKSIMLNSSTESFYTDGYYCFFTHYTNNYGKTSVDLPTMTKLVRDAVGIANMSDSISALKDFKIADAGNGNTSITYTLAPDRVGDCLDSIRRLLGRSSVQAADIRSLNGSVLVSPEGYCSAETIEIAWDSVTPADRFISEHAFSNTTTIQVNYVNIGQPVDFTLPSIENYELYYYPPTTLL